MSESAKFEKKLLDGADEDDDPPCATGSDTVCVTWKPRVQQVHSCVQQISHFFMFGSASDTERDFLSCASLTRAPRPAPEDMAWMIRVLHVPCGHAKAPGSLLLHSQCIQGCTHNWPARLNV